MSEEKNNDAKMDDVQAAAMVTSGVFIVWFVVYWGFQIQAVRELLAFAYG